MGPALLGGHRSARGPRPDRKKAEKTYQIEEIGYNTRRRVLDAGARSNH
jgi:hypothetical protein